MIIGWPWRSPLAASARRALLSRILDASPKRGQTSSRCWKRSDVEKPAAQMPMHADSMGQSVMDEFVVAIDGPSGVGKTSVSRDDR